MPSCRKGNKLEKMKIHSPHMKLRSPRMKVHSPHMKIKSPHFKIKSPKFKFSSPKRRSCTPPPPPRRIFQPRIFSIQQYPLLGSSTVMLQPGTSWRFPLKVFCKCDADIQLLCQFNIKLITGAAAIPNNQTSPRESGIPEILVEWFRGTISLTNGRHITYATDARLPETVWFNHPFNFVDHDVERGCHEYMVEITNNSDNCLVSVDYYTISAMTFKSRGSSLDFI